MVDALGDIPEVLGSRLRNPPSLLAGGNVLADTIATTDKPESEIRLVVLSVERITNRLVAPLSAIMIEPTAKNPLLLLEHTRDMEIEWI